MEDIDYDLDFFFLFKLKKLVLCFWDEEEIFEEELNYEILEDDIKIGELRKKIKFQKGGKKKLVVSFSGKRLLVCIVVKKNNLEGVFLDIFVL